MCWSGNINLLSYVSIYFFSYFVFLSGEVKKYTSKISFFFVYNLIPSIDVLVLFYFGGAPSIDIHLIIWVVLNIKEAIHLQFKT